MTGYADSVESSPASRIFERQPSGSSHSFLVWQLPVTAMGSTDQRNTLILQQKDGVSYSDQIISHSTFSSLQRASD
jgi:hypothetical protein